MQNAKIKGQNERLKFKIILMQKEFLSFYSFCILNYILIFDF